MFYLTPSCRHETRIALSQALREKREAAHLTQADLAAIIHTDRARIVRAEQGHKTVSLDFIFRALYAVGATQNDVSVALATK